MPNDKSATPRIGVSSCLTGAQVRFDGNHKRDHFVAEILAPLVELVPICPELAIGLGVPRPPIRLVELSGDIRARGVVDPVLDVTQALQTYGAECGMELAGISGYILKARSPSCGLYSTPLYESGKRPRKVAGIFANSLRTTLPLLPMEEEGRLRDTGLRDQFLEQVFAYQRWQQLQSSGVTQAGLVAFHTRHKLNLMAHGPSQVSALGQLLANPEKRPASALAPVYISLFMKALRYQATRKRHTNVLHHIMGYLKKQICVQDKQELVKCIEFFRTGQLPLIAPITLLRHHFLHHPHPYLLQQYYLYPPDLEERLRSRG